MRSKQGASATFTGTARRAQIIDCAIEVIAESGYAQASLRKIADRVGIAMSAVLYHFGSRDNLIDAVIEQMYRTALAVVVPAMSAEKTATGKINAYIRASLEYFDTNRLHLTALTQLGSSYRPKDGRRFDELGMTAELGEQLAALDVTPIFVAGQSDGEFDDFSVDSMAIALRGAVNAAVEKMLRDPEFDARGYGNDLVEIFQRALRSPR
jgi:AcrR family transcriptional regulator